MALFTFVANDACGGKLVDRHTGITFISSWESKMRFLNWLMGYIDMNRELEEKDRVIADLREKNDALCRQEKMAQRDHIEINRLYREINELKYGHSPAQKPSEPASPTQPQRIGGYPRRSSIPDTPDKALLKNSWYYAPWRSSSPSSHTPTHPDTTTSVVIATMFSNSPTKDTCSPSSDSGSSSSSSDSGSSSCDSGSF